MNRFENVIVSKLDERTKEDITELQHSVRGRRGSIHKVRSLFTDSFLAGEWISTSDLTIISGLKKTAVHRGIITLRANEEIIGKPFTYVEYYESLSGRTDRAARLLIAFASARLECPEDEVSLAGMMLPDRKTWDLESRPQTMQAAGYYFRQKSLDSFDNIAPAPSDSNVLSPVF